MGQRIIGLDVGSWSIKAVVLDSSLRRSTIVDFHEHHVPADPMGEPVEGGVEASIAATLKDLDPDSIVAAVPGGQVLIREIALPVSDDKRIRSILGFQLETVLPRPVDEVIYDYQVLRETADGASLLCPAIDRERLDTWLGMLQGAGADPRVMTTSGLAAEHLTSCLQLDDAEAAVAFVDLGHRTTTVSVVRGGRVEAVRTISRGGHQLTMALMKGLDLDFGQAEEIKHTGVRFDGYLPDGVDEAEHAQRARLLARALEPLLREVRTTIHAHAERLDLPVGSAVIFGGTAQLPGIVDLMARVLDAPVSLAQATGPLWEGFGRRAEVTATGLAGLALALRAVTDSSRHLVNFRQGEHAYESDFSLFRDKFVGIGIFALVLLALFFGRKYLHMQRLEDQQAALVAELDAFTGEIFDMTFEGGTEVIDKFELAKNAVLSPPEASGQALYPSMTAFKIFYDATELLAMFNREAPLVDGPGEEAGDDDEEVGRGPAPERKQIELTSVTADVRTTSTEFQSATMSGAGYDVVTIEGFRKKLSEHRCFTKVDQQGDTKPVRSGRREGWREFTFKLEIKCDRAGDEGEPLAEGSDANGGAQ